MSQSQFISLTFSCVLVLLCTSRVASQTSCSIHVPVPDLGYCNAVGVLEDNTDASVHETRGRIDVMQEYQGDTFKLFDQQITTILTGSTSSEADINDITEEINTLKRALRNLQGGLQVLYPPHDELLAEDSGRVKRAASLPPAQQQAIDAANLSFQTSVARVLLRLQNISKSIADDNSQNNAMHSRLLQELAGNQRALSLVERQMNNVDAAVNALMKQRNMGGGGASGVNMTGVRDGVTDLIINATVAEQLVQRQLDGLNKTILRLEQEEGITGPGIAALKAEVTNFTATLNQDIAEASNIQAAEELFEQQVSTFINDNTRDIADIRAQLGPAQQLQKTAAQRLFNATLALGTFEVNFNATRKSVDGIQSLATLARNAQQGQIGELVQLKKTISDDINIMKYAFGLLTQYP